MSLPVRIVIRHKTAPKKAHIYGHWPLLFFCIFSFLAGAALFWHNYSGGVFAAARFMPTTGSAPHRAGEVSLLTTELRQAEPPVINAPKGDVPIGKIELTGTATPGTDLVLVVDGDPVDKIIVDDDGTWAYVLDLSVPGRHVLTANTLSNSGQVVASSEEYWLSLTSPSNINPLLNLVDATGLQVGDIELNGSAAPDSVVALLVNDVQVGDTVADANGIWRYSLVIGAPGAYELVLNSIEADGSVIASSERYLLMIEAGDGNLLAIETPRYTRQPTNTPYDTATVVTVGEIAALVTSAQTRFVRPATDTPRAQSVANASQAQPALVTAEATRFGRLPTDTPRADGVSTAKPAPAPLATGQATRFVRLPTQTSTNTPVPPTATNTYTPQPTATHTPVPPTVTNTATRTPRPTSTNTPERVAIATNTETPPPPKATNTATRTPRPTSTNTATDTPEPTATDTPVPPTATNTATDTPQPTATNTPVPPTATNTATDTPEPTATDTPVPPTATNTATDTPEPTATDTPVPPTATNTVVPPVINLDRLAASVSPGQIMLTGLAEPNADLRVLVN